jgi:spectinomycin phosphotransferase
MRHGASRRRAGHPYRVGVFTEPDDLDRGTLADALRADWRIDAARLEHLPVGFGSHHWKAAGTDGSRWFVTADDLHAGHRPGGDADGVFAVLDRAFRTAAALRGSAALDFVVAPTASCDGTVLRRIDARYAVRVDPFLDAAAAGSGDYEHEDDRRRVGRLLGRLHAASRRVGPDLPGHEDFALPGRDALEEALARLDVPWDGGPFAEPARELLRTCARSVGDRLLDYDRGARILRQGASSWVVTHGEPHSANVLREPGGALRLVDWDTALVAPRERDLWMVLDEALTGWDEYRAAAGDIELDEQAIELYRRRWELADIAIFVVDFRRPHEGTDDTVTAFEGLSGYLGEL